MHGTVQPKIYATILDILTPPLRKRRLSSKTYKKYLTGWTYYNTPLRKHPLSPITGVNFARTLCCVPDTPFGFFKNKFSINMSLVFSSYETCTLSIQAKSFSCSCRFWERMVENLDVSVFKFPDITLHANLAECFFDWRHSTMTSESAPLTHHCHLYLDPVNVCANLLTSTKSHTSFLS